MGDPTRRGVRATYERIADHFAKTRHSPWPEVETFLEGRTGRVGLDVGCGNGRHAALLADVVERVVCLDASRNLLDVARADLPDVRIHPVVGDAATLPVASARVDLAVYVATLHHLPTAADRRASLDELDRVLAPGGRALVSAWCTTHARFERERGFDTTVDWTLPDGTLVPRYYHIYDPEEFRGALAESALAVREAWESSGNCYAVVGPGGDDREARS